MPTIKMRIQKISKFTFVAISSFVFCTSCFANGFETWTENMKCGEVKYKLESICKKSNDEMELNECKSQSLEITRDGIVRKIKLPELSKHSLNIYKKSGGDSKELFVIKWGCGRADGVSEAVLYYSIGGGSAPNSEAWASYNESGILMEDDDKPNPQYNKALKSAVQGMKKVHSIMPD